MFNSELPVAETFTGQVRATPRIRSEQCQILSRSEISAAGDLLFATNEIGDFQPG